MVQYIKKCNAGNGNLMSKIIDDLPVLAFSIRFRLKFMKEKAFLEF